MSNQQWTPSPTQERPKPAGFAVAALVLGIIGVVLSFMPILNNITAAGAVVGFVLGFVGLWRSRIWMSGFGTFLCGLAVILTVLAQRELAEDLDKLEREVTENTDEIKRDMDKCAADLAAWDPRSGSPAPTC